MHLIILPGNSKEFNEQWLYDSADAYKELFDSVTTHVFKHWETGEDMIDVDVEVRRLEEEAKKLDGEYTIFAKSAGTITTVKAVAEGRVNPKKCVFVGCPWGNFAEEQGDFDILLSKYEVPTLYVQQTNDMFFKYEDLEKILKEKMENYELHEIPGENHAYDNYDQIKTWMKKFI